MINSDTKKKNVTWYCVKNKNRNLSWPILQLNVIILWILGYSVYVLYQLVGVHAVPWFWCRWLLVIHCFE